MWSVQYEVNPMSAFPLTENVLCRTDSKKPWSTVSKAELSFRRTRPVTRPLSNSSNNIVWHGQHIFLHIMKLAISCDHYNTRSTSFVVGRTSVGEKFDTSDLLHHHPEQNHPTLSTEHVIQHQIVEQLWQTTDAYNNTSLIR